MQSGDSRADMPRRLDEQDIRRRLEPLFARSDVDLVVLFGSRARGSAVPSSDVDLGVMARGDIEDLRIEAIRLLETDWVDVVDLSRADPLLAMSVARYGRPIHERKPGAFASFASLALRRYNDTAKFRELEARRLREWLSARGL